MNKLIVGFILMMVAIFGFLLSAFLGTLYAFKHIDDTIMRILVDYPYPAIIAVVSFIIFKIGDKVSE